MTHSIDKVGVIGAGQMGSGIALVCAQAGIDVLLEDVADERIKAALATINGLLSRQVAKGQLDEAGRAAILGRIGVAKGFDGLADRDLVIEAASENEEVKRKIFASLRPFLKPETIVASNTSSISITRLASVTANPERFIGIHFMNPVPRMQLVELIRGIATTDDTFEVSKAFVQRLGKTATMSEDFPAFIVNRILLPMINEAVYTLYEGVGSVELIDTAMRLGANHPMGPLQLADFIGLDTCLSVMQVLHEGLADFEIPALPAACEIRRGGLARQKNAARVLRLPRGASRPDAVTLRKLGEKRAGVTHVARLIAAPDSGDERLQQRAKLGGRPRVAPEAGEFDDLARERMRGLRAAPRRNWPAEIDPRRDAMVEVDRVALFLVLGRQFWTGSRVLVDIAVVHEGPIFGAPRIGGEGTIEAPPQSRTQLRKPFDGPHETFYDHAPVPQSSESRRFRTGTRASRVQSHLHAAREKSLTIRGRCYGHQRVLVLYLCSAGAAGREGRCDEFTKSGRRRFARDGARFRAGFGRGGGSQAKRGNGLIACLETL